MRVNLGSPLLSYTGGAATVEASGATLAELLADLDRTYPGLRFRVIDEQDRIRPHMRLFVDEELAQNLGTSVIGAKEVHILAALSGG